MANGMLTPKQQLFVKEYIKDFNATQAAIRAGYKEKAAGQTGAENLKKPQIQKAIKEAQDAREAETIYDAKWIIAQIAQIAGNQEETARDRLKALELLGKYHGIWDRRPDEEQQVVKIVFETEMEDWAK